MSLNYAVEAPILIEANAFGKLGTNNCSTLEVGGNPIVSVFVDTNPGAGENWVPTSIQNVRCNKLGQI